MVFRQRFYSSSIRRMWRTITWLSTSIFLFLLLCMNYAYFKPFNYHPRPYGLPNESLVFEQEGVGQDASPADDSFYLDLISLDQTKDMVLIAEDRDWKYAGLYDPSFYYGDELIVLLPGQVRYFSEKDIQSKNPVSIMVFTDRDLESVQEWASKTRQTNEAGLPFLFAIDSQSYLYNPKIREIRNLTSIPQAGQRLYLLPSRDSSANRAVKSFLKDRGYRSRPLLTASVLQSLWQGNPFASHRTGFFVYLSLLPYFLFFLLLGMEGRKQQRHLQLHLHLGGNFWQIARRSFLGLCEQGLAPLLLLALFLLPKADGLHFLSWTNILELFLVHLLATLIPMFLVFLLSYQRAKRLERRLQ